MSPKRKHPISRAGQSGAPAFSRRALPTPVPAPAEPGEDPLLALQRMVQSRAVLEVDGVRYVWDFAAQEAVAEEDMPVGSARYEASERARFLTFREQFAPLIASERGAGEGAAIVWQPDEDAADEA